MPTSTTTETAAPAWGSYRTAEARYGLSRWTLRSLVEEGRVRAARIGTGRGVRLSFQDLDEYMEQAARPREEIDVG
jgi:excisionase family DNA binding protein